MCFILSDGLQLLRDQLYAVIYGDRRCEEGVAACLGPVAEAPKPVPAEFSSHLEGSWRRKWYHFDNLAGKLPSSVQLRALLYSLLEIVDCWRFAEKAAKL